MGGKQAVKNRKQGTFPGGTASDDTQQHGKPVRKGPSGRSNRKHQIGEDLMSAEQVSERHGSASFARRIKERADELGLSLRQVAQRAEINPSFLTRIISGERNAPSD